MEDKTFDSIVTSNELTDTLEDTAEENYLNKNANKEFFSENLYDHPISEDDWVYLD